MRLEMEYQARAAKRERKSKKMYVVAPSRKGQPKKGVCCEGGRRGDGEKDLRGTFCIGCCLVGCSPPGKQQKRPVIKAFDRELTDTTNRALKEFRR